MTKNWLCKLQVLFLVQCLLCIFYSFTLIGPIFLCLVPPDHWCSPDPNAVQILVQKRIHLAGNSREYQINTNISHACSNEGDCLGNPFKDVNEPLGVSEESKLQEFIKNMTIPRKTDGGGFDQCRQFVVDWSEVWVLKSKYLINWWTLIVHGDHNYEKKLCEAQLSRSWLLFRR